jgi:hypothetical protein
MAEWLIDSLETPEAQKALREAEIVELYDNENYEQIYGANVVATMVPPGCEPHTIIEVTILIDPSKPEQKEFAIAAVERAKNQSRRYFA